MKEVKKKDLRVLKKSIEACRKLTGAKFSYVMVKNHAKVISELKTLEESKHSPSDKLANYFELEKEVVKKFAKKDEKGEFVFTPDGDGNYHYTFDDRSKLEEAVKALQESMPEAMEEQKKADEDYNKLLNEPAGIEFFKVKVSDIPDAITVEMLASIECLIEE